MDLTIYPTEALYSVLAIIAAGFGVGMLVFQTAASNQALTRRRGNVVGGVLLIVFGGVVLITQIWAIISNSYMHMG